MKLFWIIGTQKRHQVIDENDMSEEGGFVVFVFVSVGSAFFTIRLALNEWVENLNHLFRPFAICQQPLTHDIVL